MASIDLEMKPEIESDEPVFDSPHGSIWIVAVDYAGRVSVLQTPNIHYSLLDNGPEAEYLGLPESVDDLDPGVYRWKCSYHTSVDWESGHVDGYSFEVEESTLLWSPDEELPRG
ncbi:hypothetical protein KASHIRA_01170 [Serratia phage vB_SmaM-Kashira]|nr:hypothetical protein KASHIRA_01170 [Serratia phage vB_SmaM-Kashira]